jgi:hypothetical protein
MACIALGEANESVGFVKLDTAEYIFTGGTCKASSSTALPLRLPISSLPLRLKSGGVFSPRSKIPLLQLYSA